VNLSPQSYPALFLVGWIAVLIVYERWAMASFGPQATITGLVQFCQARFPLFEALLTLAGGGLLLHLFHQGQQIP
jgi:hypothetical protein